MNVESLNQALLLLLNKSIEAAEKGAVFLAEQLPDVIQQLLLWKMVQSAIGTLMTIVFLIALVWSFRFYKKEKISVQHHLYKETIVFDADGEVHPGIIALIGIQVVLAVMAAACLSWDWLQIWVAPKVWLLEYASDILKGK